MDCSKRKHVLQLLQMGDTYRSSIDQHSFAVGKRNTYSSGRVQEKEERVRNDVMHDYICLPHTYAICGEIEKVSYDSFLHVCLPPTFMG